MGKLLYSAAAAALLLGASTVAQAGLVQIGLQESGVNGGAITTVASGIGAASLAGTSYGTFTFIQGSAQDRQLLGAPGILNSQTLDISSGSAGTLRVFVTTTGLASPGPQNFLSSFAVNDLNGLVASVNESTFLDFGDGAFIESTTLAADLFTAIGTLNAPLNFENVPGGLFSATEVFTITSNGAGNTNLTIDLQAEPVPEPGTLGLLGVGLVGAVWAVRRRNRKGGTSYA